MGLPSLLTDPNFLYLQHQLKISAREAWGILDYGWMLYNMSGDPTYESGAHLEALLSWEGKKGALVKALLQTGFIVRRGKHRLAIANADQRLYEWGRKRQQRRDDARETNGAPRRRTAPTSRPPIPIPVPLPTEGKIHTFDPGSKPAGRPGSAKDTPPATRRGSENPQQAVAELLKASTTAIGGIGARQSRHGAPAATQPIGSYDARECALWAASVDQGNEDESARAMWITRAAELSQYTGGLDYFRDLITQVYNSRNPQLHKGTGRIHNAGAFLNQRTAAWLDERRTA